MTEEHFINLLSMLSSIDLQIRVCDTIIFHSLNLFAPITLIYSHHTILMTQNISSYSLKDVFNGIASRQSLSKEINPQLAQVI